MLGTTIGAGRSPRKRVIFNENQDVTTCNLKVSLIAKGRMQVTRRGLLALLLAGLAPAQAREHRWVTDPRESAREPALRLLKLLAQGDIEAAARLSNAPQRRYEVLREYRDSVGEGAFKRVYAQYFQPRNRVLAEAALGPRRLLIWDLGEASHHLAGQFFIEVEGRFLLDDVPSKERAALQRVLQDYRRQDGTERMGR